MNDLFGAPRSGKEKGRDAEGYSAEDIEVLEGLEPVRRRPGMYIGGTDENALHHLAAEILDNAMDEAVAGHASFIEVALGAENWLTVRDNGRGIPVDSHPKFKDLSALEVILTTLHSGGKFSGKAYATSGGLHGVGSSVVNALSETMRVEVARDRVLWTQSYARGKPTSKLVNAGPVHNRRGTTIAFKPDPTIFGALAFSPARLYRLCRSKAYLFRGVQIRWSCEPVLLRGGGKDETPHEAVLHFPRRAARQPGGGDRRCRARLAAALGRRGRSAGGGRMVPAPAESSGPRLGSRAADGFLHSYCNTVPTPLGRDARGGLPRRAGEGPAHLGRASRQPAGQPDRRRRSAGPTRGEAVRCSCATRNSRARPRSG